MLPQSVQFKSSFLFVCGIDKISPFLIKSELIIRDKEEDDRVHSRNAVEEYVLQTRSKLYQEYEKFVTEQVRYSKNVWDVTYFIG